jgi:hypothetical protein
MSPVERALVASALCLLFSFPAVAAEPEQGRTFVFGIRRAELISNIKSIGMMPLVVSAEVPNADAVTARYESEIVARLTSAGFSVTPPAAMRGIRERTKATLGGLYDPVHGKPIKEKLDALNEFSLNEYRATYKVDALLETEIVLRPAEFSGTWLRWDGVEDSATGESGWADFWKPTSNSYGKVPALSFAVRLVEATGKDLYVGVAGLQVLGYWKDLGGTWVTKDRMLRIDPKYIMSDPARDTRALSLALDPLLHGKVSAFPKVTTIPAPQREAATVPRVSREELLAHFPRLMLASLDLGEIKQRDNVRLRYRDALTQKLTQLGFEVTGGDEYDRLWDAERTAAGGFFDPFTGKLDAAKLKASRQHVLRSMQEHPAATAIVLPHVIFRAAPFDSGVAEWDGIKESLTGKGSLANFFDPIRGHSGALGALSLDVQLIDPAGESLFEGVGGIQLAARFNPAGPEPLAESELFADPAKDTRAIDIALAPLAPPAAPAHH